MCIRHGAKKKKKRYSSDGCTNQVIQGGVCLRHGAKLKLCINEGRANNAQRGGVAEGMGQSGNYAALMGARINLSKEEFASGMVQR